MKIIPNGEGGAILRRNKRGGIRLRVHIDPSYPGPFCPRCFCLKHFGGDTEECLYECKEFERETGTRKFWFEKDEN